MIAAISSVRWMASFVNEREREKAHCVQSLRKSAWNEELVGRLVGR
jgi:hypothetical protein